ncbi:imidazole glycerol phosphate synthase subunit HisH [Synechococcus sp. CC9616]|uniref:imidazole glycerol phosphate synthase subunit HisH n=1 Tax=Synechococcus sp. CC9616 TaxID=110663 RepID=UPI0004AF0D85|nr:imidazole glycerol phosphate synthase subunit HisH [Synechococcus sp. CC9616]
MKKRTSKILIIDHGVGNIGSLVNALNFLNFDAMPVDHEDNFKQSQNQCGFILPGVGTFDEGMKNIRGKKLDRVIEKLVKSDVPGLGICLGMQLLCKQSEESSKNETGLGYFDASVKFLDNSKAPVPSIGWNSTYQSCAVGNKNLELLNGDFYYLHSYYVKCWDINNRVACYKHGDSEVTAAIEKNSLLGVQFHPEKSQYQGLSLIKNFFGGM